MSARPFQESLDALPPERRAAVEARAAELIEEAENLMTVRELLRQAQAEVAAKLAASRADFSKIERRADLYVSSLRDLVQAMGGRLEVVATFPGKAPVRIKQFDGTDLLPIRKRKGSRAKAGGG